MGLFLNDIMIRRVLTWRQGRKCPALGGALLAWVGVIFFSSTSLAGKASDTTLTRFAVAHIRPYDIYDLYHRCHVLFLAEKNVHLTMFIVLAMLIWRILPDMPHKAAVVFLCGTVIGCCSELAQCLFPGRDPAVRDVLINALGTGIGTAINFYWPKSQYMRWVKRCVRNSRDVTL
jgi:VanZ family protein